MRKLSEKKSQITIFLVFALILVIGTVYIISTGSESKITEELKSESESEQIALIVKGTIESCLSRTFKTAILKSGYLGAFIYNDSKDKAIYINTFSDYTSEEDRKKINLNENRTLIHAQEIVYTPLKNKRHIVRKVTGEEVIVYNRSISDDIERYVSENLFNCINQTKFEIEKKIKIEFLNQSNDIVEDLKDVNPSSKVYFRDDSTLIEIKLPVNIKYVNSTKSIAYFDSLSSNINLPYDDYLEISRKLLNKKI